MTSKQLTKLYDKRKSEYLAEIQNDNGNYTCKGCDNDFMTIQIHHIIKRSKLKYFYADIDNFMELCTDCHVKAEGTIKQQKELNCYQDMKTIEGILLILYYSLKPYEQTLLWKYG